MFKISLRHIRIAAYPREYHKMHFQKLLRNKKAQETVETGRQARGLSIQGIFLILILVPFMTKLIFPLIAQAGEQGSMVSVEQFAEEFQKVANGSQDIAVVDNFNLGEDYVLAIFGSKTTYLEDTCYLNENFLRPTFDESECHGNEICICLCSEDDACKNPIFCIPIKSPRPLNVSAETNTEFDTNFGKDMGEGKADPLIYGDCGIMEPSFGIQGIVVEKVSEGTLMVSDNACMNKEEGGRRGDCMLGDRCGGGAYEVTDYKCNENEVCCCCT